MFEPSGPQLLVIAQICLDANRKGTLVAFEQRSPMQEISVWKGSKSFLAMTISPGGFVTYDGDELHSTKVTDSIIRRNKEGNTP